jgi:hypothetical protein
MLLMEASGLDVIENPDVFQNYTFFKQHRDGQESSIPMSFLT